MPINLRTFFEFRYHLVWIGRHPQFGWMFGQCSLYSPQKIKTVLKKHHIDLTWYFLSPIYIRIPRRHFNTFIALLDQHQAIKADLTMTLQKTLMNKNLPYTLRWPILEIHQNIISGASPFHQSMTLALSSQQKHIINLLYSNMWSMRHLNLLACIKQKKQWLTSLCKNTVLSLTYPLILTVILLLTRRYLDVPFAQWSGYTLIAILTILLSILRHFKKSSIQWIISFFWIHALNHQLQLTPCIIKSLKQSNQFQTKNKKIIHLLENGIPLSQSLSIHHIHDDFNQLLSSNDLNQKDLQHALNHITQKLLINIQIVLQALNPIFIMIIGLDVFRLMLNVSQSWTTTI